MKKYSLSALVAAGLLVGGLSAGSASAADLGGNCCADLEERIAELEATTARKGNRKVTLTISGWVGEQVMWWDNDNPNPLYDESNTYVGGLGSTLSSHFKFTGQATITPGWYAGYVIHVEVYGSENLLMTNQNVATGPNLYDSFVLESPNFTGISTLQSFWFIKATTSASCPSVCSRRLRTTPPFFRMVRARSLPPTTCSSITAAFSCVARMAASARFGSVSKVARTATV